MSIIIKNLTYLHTDKELLFKSLYLSLNKGEKIGLVGNNGTGKSTLFKIITKELSFSSGELYCSVAPYYVPQHFGQYDHLSVAEAIHIDKKLRALCAILQGDVSAENYASLNDDWNIEERLQNALSIWDLTHISASQKLGTMSGGEKTRLFLAGITLHEPEIILLDEPSNHLDYISKGKLYNLLKDSKATVMVISHDRTLLNLLPAIYELHKDRIACYPGNYENYKIQKEQERDALHEKIKEQEKSLRTARKIACEMTERKQKQDIRGKKHSAKKGVGKMAMNALRDRSEKSGSKLKDIHEEKTSSIKEKLMEFRSVLPNVKLMKTDFNTSPLHYGKTLIEGQNVRFSYDKEYVWKMPLNFLIKSGDRIAITGRNGSGKTTLLKLMLGVLNPSEGIIEKAAFKYSYLDQEYSMIDDKLTVFEQLSCFNTSLQDHEVKAILNRFLFSFDMWDELCGKLSGGERMKLALCCLMVDTNTPDLFILDEPTNNIDIQNIEVLTAMVKEFKGTVVLISHDAYFVEQIGIDYSIAL
ncbi:MAG: ATP-binding cassette domain-containing protein [Bacteroidales bacterium]|jgi:ATPase subunit of ABC transporter with duplicated ATPase domains|nr:ATP-binding cassette domain-containing protein [Bacteroidales bacterium]